MLYLFVSLATAFAADTSLVRFYPSEVLRNETVEFRPIDGHHFSFEAPQSCGSGSLNEKNPRTIKCQFLTAGITEPTLNVCDDKKTFCKPVQLKIDVLQRESAEPVALKKNEHNNVELKKTLLPGFAMGSPVDVLREVQKQERPVLVMVSTDWCPPCNESKEYLIPSEAFKNATKDWFKIYVDGDAMNAAEWEKSVPYHYFPSYVLHNAKMQEIGRYTGELRQSEFSDWAKAQSKLVDDPIASLRERVNARLAGSWMQKFRDLIHGVKREQAHSDEERLLGWALDQDEKGLIAALIGEGDFASLRPQILRYKIDEIERLEGEQKKDLKSDKIEVYRALLKETFHGEHWSDHLKELCQLDKEACKPYLAQIPERIEYLDKHGNWTQVEKDSALADEYVYIVSIYEDLADKPALKNFAKACVDRYTAMEKSSALKISRSGNQGMVACLEMSGDFAREEKTLKALMEAYPSEPTFFYRMARMRRAQKKWEEALTWAAKAETLAYGYNWFMVQTLKVGTLLELKKGDEAKRVIHSALAQIQLDPSTESRNQRLVATLRNLESRASAVSRD